MKDIIVNLFEENSAGVAIILTILIVVLAIGGQFGFYTLAILLASKCFGFVFKWVYVFGLWVGVLILQSIFKVKEVKVKTDE